MYNEDIILGKLRKNREQLENIAKLAKIVPPPTGGDDAANINSCLTGGGHVYIPYNPSGYNIANPIIIPSNTWLEIDPNVTITLANSSNCYMVTNSDTTNGNSNIKITGGRFIGNGANQTVPYAGTYLTAYWGFMFMFNKVQGLEVDNVYMQESQRYFNYWDSCSDVKATNIKFMGISKLGGGLNGDGLHLNGCNNVYIENISGYTNDDLIAIEAATYEQMYSHPFYPTGGDSNNIIIKNIHPAPRGTEYSGSAIIFISNNTKKVSNVVVDGVLFEGAALYGIHFGSVYQSVCNFGKIKLSNIDIKVTAANMSGILLQGETVNVHTYIDYLSIDNYTFENASTGATKAITNIADIKQIDIGKTNKLDSNGGSSIGYYQDCGKYQGNNVTKMNIGYPLFDNRDGSTISIKSGRVTMSGEVYVDPVLINPQSNIKVFNTNSNRGVVGPVLYTTAWKSILDSSAIGSVPLNIPGCKFWIDASALTGYNDNDNITYLTELAGRYNAVKYSPPVYKTNIKNGLPAILFSAMDQGLIIKTTDGSFDALNILKNVAGATIVLVASASTVPTTEQNLVYIAVGTSTEKRICMQRGVTSGQHQVTGRRLDNDVAQSISGGTIVEGAFSIDIGIADYANAHAYLRKNGVEVTDGAFQTAGNTSNTASNLIRIGANGTNGFLGYLCEAIIYDTALTVEQCQTLETYLSNKWGITLG